MEWEREKTYIREDAMEQKAVEDARSFLAMNVLTPEQVAQGTGLPLDQVLELQKELTPLAKSIIVFPATTRAEPAPTN